MSTSSFIERKQPGKLCPTKYVQLNTTHSDYPYSTSICRRVKCIISFQHHCDACTQTGLLDRGPGHPEKKTAWCFVGRVRLNMSTTSWPAISFWVEQALAWGCKGGGKLPGDVELSGHPNWIAHASRMQKKAGCNQDFFLTSRAAAPPAAPRLPLPAKFKKSLFGLHFCQDHLVHMHSRWWVGG